jgi:hypothetical protein
VLAWNNDDITVFIHACTLSFRECVLSVYLCFLGTPGLQRQMDIQGSALVQCNTHGEREVGVASESAGLP